MVLLRSHFELFFLLVIKKKQNMKILTFNILAQVFADVQKYYPPGTNVDASYRRAKLDGFLGQIVPTLDIIGLQEVSIDTTNAGVFRPGEYGHLQSQLDSQFHSFFVAHSPSYWAKYYDADPTSQFAYIDNGNALFLRKSVFPNVQFRVASLKSGQRVPIADTFYKGTPLSVAVVHLNSDVAGDRKADLIELTENHLATGNCIVLGDYNAPTDQGNLVEPIQQAGLVNLVKQLSDQTGFQLYEQTRPDSTSYYNSNIFGSPIDHICARGLTVDPIPSTGVHGTVSGTKTGVLDFLVWVTYPLINGQDTNQPGRIFATLEQCGSDHFPVVATVL